MAQPSNLERSYSVASRGAPNRSLDQDMSQEVSAIAGSHAISACSRNPPRSEEAVLERVDTLSQSASNVEMFSGIHDVGRHRESSSVSQLDGLVTQKKKYAGVGNAYLVGRVCRVLKQSLFQIMWLDSQFQNHVEMLNLSTVQRGNASYRSLHGNTTSVGWSRLCAVDDGEDVCIDADMDTLEQYMEPFDPPVEPPITLTVVESIRNMRFEPANECVAPTDLFHHNDGSTKTRIRPEYKHLVQHSASSSFFAYIPVSFWQQIVGETNTYARLHSIALTKPFSLDEVMTFLGILFYMALADKGEYSNYWGEQVEDVIFGSRAVGLDKVMTLRRFKELRQALCFQCVEANSANNDQAARIRPLLNLLKTTGSKYVEVGRDVALDEASVACRSKYEKATHCVQSDEAYGQVPFQDLYAMLRYVLDITKLSFAFDIAERLNGVTAPEEIRRMSDEIVESSSIRQCVLEVVRPLYNTRRVINSDHYYTSVQLLIALRLKGLYARGTVRKTSSHFPRHVLLEKKECARGASRQAVTADKTMVAASWFNSAIVTVISIADASTLTTVTRQVRSDKRSYTAPTCIKAYNASMQGVDRLDQIRARFSLSDGHSFKKWHKKLALALIDVARANVYLTRKLVVDMRYDRDSHRDFVVELIAELRSGKWKEAPGERRMFYADTGSGAEAPDQTSPSSTNVHVSQKPYTCHQKTWTCWEKYHRFYLPSKLFSSTGKVRMSSQLYRMKRSQSRHGAPMFVKS
ncbi:LOW QUALITY PROTEIN: Transposase [Phytophthora palmivora]|uniref:Transposase n=1 Tax=Phytophthora palmivora TaxID=4796 RepID=A0A2P4WX99_9STRA|nr:LOW QUALITY PROTEIN: Transposase [Phytophthora palmivora]